MRRSVGPFSTGHRHRAPQLPDPCRSVLLGQTRFLPPKRNSFKNILQWSFWRPIPLILGQYSFRPDICQEAAHATHPFPEGSTIQKMKKLQSFFVAALMIWLLTYHVYGGWNLRQSPVMNAPLNAVIFGNGQFVAVGGNGTILTSANGSNWVSRVTGTTDTLWSVVSGSNLFVVVGNSGTTLVSSNGVEWSLHKVPPLGNAPYPLNLLAVTYGQGVFSACGSFTSTNGADWNVNPTTAFCPSSMCFGNGVFTGVLPGDNFTGAYLFFAANATNWIQQVWFPGFPTAHAIAYGAGRFVAVGGDTDPRYNSMVTSVSTNGVDWSTQKVIGNSTFLRYLSYGGGHFFALGGSSTWAISSDGFSWATGKFPPTPPLRASAYGADTYAVVGDNGTILQSDSDISTVNLSLTVNPSPLITVSGAEGRLCQLEFSDNLNPNDAWQTAALFALTNAPSIWMDSVTSERPQRYYRAVLLP
jgi:hypothetical protein